MAPLPHFDGGKLHFICEICNRAKISSELEHPNNQYNIICKSCWTQIKRENKINKLLPDETEN